MTSTLRLQAADPEDLRRAAQLLRDGKLVAFATETVYGLGANALAAAAVARIFEAKGRPAWDPLIVHVPEFAALERIIDLDESTRQRAQGLAAAFWPGPLTLLLPRAASIPDAVTAGRPLVGVRIPAHPTAQTLLRLAGVPVAAPSANRFGHVSPTAADHVLADLDGRIDAVLDAGPCTVGVESTVLDPTQTPAMLYRSGAVTPQQIAEAIGAEVTTFEPGPSQASPEALPSPGIGIRHYAPEARVVLTAGNPESFWAAVDQVLSQEHSIGLLLPGDWPDQSREDTDAKSLHRERWGQWSDPKSLAASLFAGLRALESRGVSVIVCPLPEPGGLRDAVRDRLLKAAKPK